jgi:DNA adenine methylase
MAEPFLKWAGGKRQLINDIEWFLPKEIRNVDTYIEPFIGGGALLFHLLENYNFKNIHISDVNPELILCYEQLKISADKVIKELEIIINGYEKSNDKESFFYEIRSTWNSNLNLRDLDSLDRFKRVAQVIFLNKTCFNGLFRLNSKGEFNVPYGRYKNPSFPTRETLLEVQKALEKVTIHNDSYEECVNWISGKTFVYFDPPYRPISKTSSFVSYSKGDFDDRNQKELAEFITKLDKLKVKFLLSNSDPKNGNLNDEFFDDLYHRFSIERISANRAINSDPNKRGKISELLIRNYNKLHMGNPSKDLPWQKIFDTYNIQTHDFDKTPFHITAKQIKEACQEFKKTAEKEVRILCYQAQRKDKPKVFTDNGLFLLPVKNGEYLITRGEGYVNIPDIDNEPILFKSKFDFRLYSNEIGNSEMQHLDFAYASGMVEHFCNVGQLFLTIRGRKYTPEFSFKVNNFEITQKSVQTEVDAGYEGENHIILIEGKNTGVDDVIIRQLYYPYRKWSEHLGKRKKVLPVFFEKRDFVYMFWMYEFEDFEDYNSIRLVKSASYIIETTE